jgi:hypothetical protein
MLTTTCERSRLVRSGQLTWLRTQIACHKSATGITVMTASERAIAWTAAATTGIGLMNMIRFVSFASVETTRNSTAMISIGCLTKNQRGSDRGLMMRSKEAIKRSISAECSKHERRLSDRTMSCSCRDSVFRVSSTE